MKMKVLDVGTLAVHIYKGDNRSFGKPSSLDQSRLTIHLDTFTGQMETHVSSSHLRFTDYEFKPSSNNRITLSGEGNMYEIKVHATNSAAPKGSPSIDNTIQLMKNSIGEWQARMIGDAFPSWEISSRNGNNRVPLVESLSRGNSVTGPFFLMERIAPRVINYGENATQNFIP